MGPYITISGIPRARLVRVNSQVAGVEQADAAFPRASCRGDGAPHDTFEVLCLTPDVV